MATINRMSKERKRRKGKEYWKDDVRRRRKGGIKGKDEKFDLKVEWFSSGLVKADPELG